MRDFKLKHFAIIFSFILLACQDTDLEPEAQIDADMEEAWARAEDFLSTARIEATDKDVTVIRYNMDLLYNTNTSTGDYDAINEMTVTAVSMQGGYVFWHAGLGVKQLLGIELDEDSQDALGEENTPFEVLDGEYWALWIPSYLEYDDDDDIYLKYDIIYETYTGDIVRLDPKIQIKNTH